MQPDDIKVREAMAEIYTSQKEYDSALVLYMEILQLDKTNKEAYQHLISIYDEMGDYDSILSLKEDVTDENILMRLVNRSYLRLVGNMMIILQS